MGAAFRRQGIGRKMMDYAVERARKQSVQTVCLNVDPEREAAVALYLSMGFVEVSRRKDYYGVGRDCLEMEYSLHKSPT